MLTCADLSPFDLPSLRTRLQGMMLRQDRYRREAESIGITADMTEGFRLVAQASADLETLADLEKLVDLLRLSPAEKGERRAAPVLQLVPRPEGDPVRPAPRLGPIERLRLALGRSASRRKVA